MRDDPLIDEPQDDLVEVVQIDATLTDTFVIQKNIAANGRLFSTLVVVICLAAFVMGHGSTFAALAMFAAIPVGAAVILDQLPVGVTRLAATIANYAVSAAVVLIFLLSIG